MEYFIAPDARACAGCLLRSYGPGDGAKLSKAVSESYEHLRTYMPWAKPVQTEEDCDELQTYYDEGLECGLATFDVAAADVCLDGAAAGAYVDCSAMTFSVGQLGEGDACAYLDSGCGPGLLCAVPGGSFEDYGVCIPAKGLGESCTRHAECVTGDCEASECVALEVRPINCAFPFN